MRHFLIHLHRYAGLLLAPFLVIVGLTGSLLAFHDELDYWLNPALLGAVAPDSMNAISAFDLFTIHEQIEQREPKAQIDMIRLRHEAGKAYHFILRPRIDPETGQPFELPYTELYINPYTSEPTGTRTWGEASLAKENIMPFLFRLHYSLAMPEHLLMFGVYTLGIAALLWFFDCFTGLYLTLPPGKKSFNPTDVQSSHLQQHSHHFWRRWKPAWQIKASRFNYDLHRASGLWLWPMLLVMAWSSVAFNLHIIYQPTMSALLNKRNLDAAFPTLENPVETPRVNMRTAWGLGRSIIDAAAEQQGFTVEHETFLLLDRERGMYFYHVKTDQEAGGKYGETIAALDADTGALKLLITLNDDSVGDVIHRWIVWLHTARVFGLPMQILICMTGLIVAALSITGIVIWRRKRTSRQRPKAKLKSRLAGESGTTHKFKPGNLS